MRFPRGHHTYHTGRLIEIDNAKGRQENAGVEYLNPRQPSRAVRVDGWDQHGTQYQYPYPLSEQDVLVAAMPWGYRWTWRVSTRAIGPHRCKHGCGIYCVHTETDAREILYCDDEVSSTRPIPLGPRPLIQPRPRRVDYTQREGAYFIQDVYLGRGLEGVPRGTFKKLRVIAPDWRVANAAKNGNLGPTSISRVSNPVSIAERPFASIASTTNRTPG